MLDMMSLLIQVLLINVHFGVLSQLSTTTGMRETTDVSSGLLLQVDVEADGYHIAWSEGMDRLERVVACKAPCATGDDWDAKGLGAVLADVKRLHPTDNQAVLAPHGDIPFEVVARTMDALRADPSGRPLFPDIGVSSAP